MERKNHVAQLTCPCIYRVYGVYRVYGIYGMTAASFEQPAREVTSLSPCKALQMRVNYMGYTDSASRAQSIVQQARVVGICLHVSCQM